MLNGPFALTGGHIYRLNKIHKFCFECLGAMCKQSHGALLQSDEMKCVIS